MVGHRTKADRVGSRRGMTLWEMIVVMVVFAIAIPPLLTLMGRAMENNLTVRSVQTATMLGRDLMEEILSKRFDERTSPSWGPIGAETGETRATYDDVDDFDAIEDEDVGGALGDFLATVEVYFVNPDTAGLDTSQGKGAGTLDYKRVDVTISNPYVGNQTFSTVVSRARSLSL